MADRDGVDLKGVDVPLEDTKTAVAQVDDDVPVPYLNMRVNDPRRDPG
jgi:hypothetical protein